MWWKLLIAHTCFWFCFQILFCYISVLVRAKGLSIKVLDAMGISILIGIPSGILHLIILNL